MNPVSDDRTRVFRSDPLVLRVGRAGDNDIVVDDSFVSMHHVELRRVALGWMVRDLGSSNGTTLNGVPVDGLSPATYGDMLQLGRTHFRLNAEGLQELSPVPLAGQAPAPSLATVREGGLPPRHDPISTLRSPPAPSVPVSPGAGNDPVAQSGSPGTPDDSFVWALAFTPLLYLLVDAALGSASPEAAAGWGLLVALAVNSTLVVLDHRRLPDAAKPNIWIGLTLIPIYLFQRASRLRQSMTIPLAWCIAFAVALIMPLATGVGMHLDSPAVEQSIESGIQNQVGLTVSADCPGGIAVDPGSTFQCVVEAIDGSTAIVDVTIQNAAGDVVWQVRN